jgi:hypothetical protein
LKAANFKLGKERFTCMFKIGVVINLDRRNDAMATNGFIWILFPKLGLQCTPCWILDENSVPNPNPVANILTIPSFLLHEKPHTVLPTCLNPFTCSFW